MEILDHKAVADHISAWLRERLTIGGILRPAVLGLSGGIDSALVALLCLHGKIPLRAVNMPCHSSRWSHDRAAALAKDFGFDLLTVDLTECSDLIAASVDAGFAADPTRNDRGGLYSCLRAPVLDYVAKRVGGLIVGTGNRDEDRIVRYFAKRGDGAVDISPIADLHKSEVKKMFAWLSGPVARPASAQGILDAKPSADLWGGAEQYDEDELGLTYDQVEEVDRFVTRAVPDFWTAPSVADREEALKNVAVPPGLLPVIMKVSAIELATKHKENGNIPICHVHDHVQWFKE